MYEYQQGLFGWRTFSLVLSEQCLFCDAVIHAIVRQMTGGTSSEMICVQRRTIRRHLRS